MKRPTQHLLLALLTAVLAGCGGPSAMRADDPLRTEALRTSRALEAENRLSEAGTVWLRASEQARDRAAVEYRLRAAEAFAVGGEVERARTLLALPEGPSDTEVRWRRLALGRIALAEGLPEEALAQVPAQTADTAPPDVAAKVRQIRALAHEDAGRVLAAAMERVELELLLEEPGAISRNRRTLWEGLGGLPVSALEEARRPPPDTLGGWVELALLTATSLYDGEGFVREANAWRARYPGHPATFDFLPELIATSRTAVVSPARVALLLPFSGSFGGAGEAVRDGFLAAWLADANNPRRPALTLHDTGEGDPVELYLGAVAAGAEFVVGPLDRFAVGALVVSGAISVPTLALNHPGDALATRGEPATHTLFHFALAPEDEARRVAERARGEGHHRAAILAPDGEWGQRVADGFTRAWEALGGVVADRALYDPDAPDMSGPVATLLNVDASERRYQRLRQVIPRLRFEARPRQDLDFLFLAAFPRQARQIGPQLRYHRAAELPVWSSSHVYAGVPDPGSDHDVEGVIFGDMPWILLDAPPAAALREQLRAALPRPPGFLRLQAFGADAYRLIPDLARLRGQGGLLPAATGGLSVDETNRVSRDLVWARFEEGVPRVLAPEAATGEDR